MTEAELDRAFLWLERFMRAYRLELLAMARGRFAEGVFRYPGGPLYHKTEAELVTDVAEEIADALVYAARKLALPVGVQADERRHDQEEQQTRRAECPCQHGGVGEDAPDDERADDDCDCEACKREH